MFGESRGGKTLEPGQDRKVAALRDGFLAPSHFPFFTNSKLYPILPPTKYGCL